jgi:mRNA interferase RelE/StbE
MWHITLSKQAQKTLRKLGAATQRDILLYLEEKIAVLDNPKQAGKALSGKLKGLWRYRVGDYRVVCQIRHETITILILDVGHRKEVYRD